MATGNTIGRIVGQAPANAGASPDQSNPAAKLMAALQQLQGMVQQLQGMMQQGGGGGGGGGPSPQGGSPPATSKALADQLTKLGEMAATKPASMEGPPNPGQALTKQIAGEIFEHTMAVSGQPGKPVDAQALAAAEQKIADLAKGAPSAAQAAQAVDNATTKAATRGANPPVLQMIQKLLDMLKQTLSQAQGSKGGSRGAQIRG